MKDRVLQLFGVETGEKSMVSLLLLQSVFLGLFLGAFDISAHSLFLSLFPETIMAQAYVVSGVVGIILTTIYSALQSRLQFRGFSLLNLLFVTLATLVLWAILAVNPSKTVVFSVFVMMGPLNILAMLGFWGTSGRLFSLRQGKRLFGLIDAGQIVGVVISGYTIPLLLTFGFTTPNIMLLSAIAVGFAAVIQIRLGLRFSSVESEEVIKGSAREAVKLFLTNPYIRYMGLFITVSVMSAFFIQYSFMGVTREQFPEEQDMASFLGLFIGSMMLFTLFLKTFIFSYLIRNYGLKLILVLSPILIFLFALVATLVATFMGYREGSTGFIIFFLVLALSRLFSKALKDSLESPSFKVIYQTLGEKIRFSVQSFVDGTVNEAAALTSGLMLSGLGLLVMGQLIHFSYALLVIAAIWCWFGFRLYSEYRKAIVRSLEDISNVTETISDESHTLQYPGKTHSRFLIRKNYFELINGNISLFSGSAGEPVAIELAKMCLTTSDRNMVAALEKLTAIPFYSGNTRALLSDALEKCRKSKVSYDLFSANQRSKKADEILMSDRKPQPAELLRLLRDSAMESRRAALLAIGKTRYEDMIPEVCEQLSTSEVVYEANAVLHSFGSAASGELVRYFMKNTGNITLARQLATIMAQTSFQETEGIIYQMLWSSSRSLRGKAASVLSEKGWQPTVEERDKIHQLIIDVIGIITWFKEAELVLDKSEHKNLAHAVGKDMDWWYDFLFNLIAIACDRRSVDKIRKNLSAGTLESVNFALEMIDIVADESIKARVSCCVDIIGNEEKLHLLHQFYPGRVPELSQLLLEIITRDYNLISVNAKAAAIRVINYEELDGDNIMTIKSLLFSPEKILVEESTRLLRLIDDYEWTKILSRLPERNRKIVEAVRCGNIAGISLLSAKSSFLKSRLESVTPDDIILLAEHIQITKCNHKERESDSDSLIWRVSEYDADAIENESLDKEGGTEVEKDGKEYCYTIFAVDLEKWLASYDNHFESVMQLIDETERAETEIITNS